MLAPRRIGISSISSYFPIPKYQKQVRLRRKNGFSVFLSIVNQKYRVFQLVNPDPTPKVCAIFPILQNTQTFCNAPDGHHMYSLCILTFIFKSTELHRLQSLLQAQNSVFLNDFIRKHKQALPQPIIKSKCGFRRRVNLLCLLRFVLGILIYQTISLYRIT